MAKIRGTLKHSDLEGGVWVFQTESGEQYHLSHLESQWEKDGLRLELEGEVDNQMVSIGMMGATFRVARARSL